MLETLLYIDIDETPPSTGGNWRDAPLRGRARLAPRGMSVRTALVRAGELAPEVVERGYFDSIVPVEELPGLP